MATPRSRAPAASPAAPSANGGATDGNAAERSGDWAPDEHARFLQALEMYGSGSSGQEWVLIAKHVGTRSEEATRYHAHAYFMMLQHKQQAGVPEAATTASSATPSAARPRSRLSELVSPTSVASKGSASPSNARASTSTPRSAKRKARRTSGSGGKKSPDGVGTSAGAGAGVGAGESATTPRNGTKSPKRRRRRKQVSLALQHIPSPSALSSPGSSLWGSPTVTLGLGAAAWTQEEDSIFENGLALYDEATIGRWDKVAAMIPHKSADDVRRRYQLLLFDVAKLEAGAPVSVSYRADRKSRTPRPGSTPPALTNGSLAGGRRRGSGGRPSSTRSLGPTVASPGSRSSGSQGGSKPLKSPLALLHDAAMARVAQGHAFGLPTASERLREASRTPRLADRSGGAKRDNGPSSTAS